MVIPAGDEIINVTKLMLEPHLNWNHTWTGTTLKPLARED